MFSSYSIFDDVDVGADEALAGMVELAVVGRVVDHVRFGVTLAFYAHCGGTASVKVEGILGGIYDYYMKHPWELPNEMLEIVGREGLDRAVCDYVSGMTDGYAMEKYGEIFIPAAWTVK